MKFEFATASAIVFGRGSSSQIPDKVNALGRRVLLVSGASLRALECAGSLLRGSAHEFEIEQVSVVGEPTVDMVTEFVEVARKWSPQAILAVGGGSVLDAGKAIGILLANEGSALDYLEVIGKGRSLSRASVPVVAVPTTAGTGSEVTRNAVLTSTSHEAKASLRSPHMLPALALVDPALTDTMPPDVTASTGLDALTQLLEPYVCIRANALTDQYARLGLELCAKSLESAVRSPTQASRDDMALASLLGGMCLANSGLGAVHGLAAVLGGRYGASHGSVCAALLPAVTNENMRWLEQNGPPERLVRYDEAARLLVGPDASRRDLVDWLRSLSRRLGIPGLGGLGAQTSHVAEIAKAAMSTSSMKANPALLAEAELAAVLNASW